MEQDLQSNSENSVSSYEKLAEAIKDSKERRGYHHEDDERLLAEYEEALDEKQGEIVLIDNLGALATWNDDMKGSRAWTG